MRERHQRHQRTDLRCYDNWPALCLADHAFLSGLRHRIGKFLRLGEIQRAFIDRAPRDGALDAFAFGFAAAFLAAGAFFFAAAGAFVAFAAAGFSAFSVAVVLARLALRRVGRALGRLVRTSRSPGLIPPDPMPRVRLRTRCRDSRTPVGAPMVRALNQETNEDDRRSTCESADTICVTAVTLRCCDRKQRLPLNLRSDSSVAIADARLRSTASSVPR